MERNLAKRFFLKVDKTDSCWLWLGGKNAKGYGVLRLRGDKMASAHRFSLMMVSGCIPEGMQVDHLCRVRNCVNPRHLEIVTSQENSRRSPISITTINHNKTHCLRGHPFDDVNTGIQQHKTKKWRYCRTCVKAAYLKKNNRLTSPSHSRGC